MNSPFKFLDPFTKDDRALFFGRDQEIEELYHKVFESKMLLVYGISGTGKSSLINCGLANKFNAADWLPVNIRRGSNTAESFASAIQKVALTEISFKAMNEASFRKAIRSLYLDHFKPIYFIFDQFEELFIFGNKEEKQEFIQIVKSILESDLQCHFLFVIREEYLAGVTEFERQIPTILANRIRIEKMTSLNARQAIEGPCKVAGIQVEEGFSEQLLNRFSSSSEVELTYLQVYLDKLFKLASSNSTNGIHFTNTLLDEAGDVKDLLGSFLEEQIAQLPDPDSALVVLKAFVSSKGTKRQVTEEDILDYSLTLGKNLSIETLRDLIQRFIALRILRDKDDAGRYELRHDALASKIFEKITIFEKDLLEIRQFIENSHANYLKRGILLSVADLKYLGQYEDKIFLRGHLLEFVEKSKVDIKAKQKVLNWITGLSVAVSLIVFALMVVYFSHQSDISESKEKALRSLSVTDNPAFAFNTAVTADKTLSSGYTLKGIFNSYFNLWEESILTTGKDPFLSVFDFTPCKAEILSASFSDNGKYICGSLADSTIRIWDISGKLIRTIPFNEPILLVKIAANSQFIAGVSKSGNLKVFNWEAKKLLDCHIRYDSLNTQDIFSFAPQRELLVCLVDGNKALIFDLKTGKMIQELIGHTDDLTSVCVSPDERFIATASKDKTVKIWYYNRNKRVWNLYSEITGHKGIVWSALFNYESNYIITASADSCVLLWKLTGEAHEWIPYNNSDYTLRHLSPICRAEFTKSPNCLLLQRYSSASEACFREFPDRESISCFFSKTRIVSMASSKPYQWNTVFLTLGFSPVYELDTLLNGFDISPHKYGIYQAFCSYIDTATIFVCSKEKFMLNFRRLPGLKPQFSPDGNYLLTVDKKKLHLFPANEDEIKRLAYDQKIFGDIVKSE